MLWKAEGRQRDQGGCPDAGWLEGICMRPETAGSRRSVWYLGEEQSRQRKEPVRRRSKSMGSVEGRGQGGTRPGPEGPAAPKDSGLTLGEPEPQQGLSRGRR